jgi:diguanylate cyclase (GGDEF)-like protein
MSLGREIERATRFGRPLALLALDLDFFKNVNDTYGHQRGDSVLVEVAARLSSQTRDVDTLARYGGEEFVLLLPETDLQGAQLAAERIGEVVRAAPFGGPGEEPLRVTVSVGLAVFPSHATTARDLLRAGDTALYAAKDAGRDTYRISAPAVADPSDVTAG